MATLLEKKKAIDVRWVYAFKYNLDGIIIQGKEKARLMAQEFSQQPEDYRLTYASVVKVTSIWIALAYAAMNDFEIFSFDVKTAFLNAPLSHELYCKQILGFSDEDPKKVNKLLQVIYGLKQSLREWYNLLREVLESIGLIRCEVNHMVFFGTFKSPPHHSIPKPADGTNLFIIVCVHVDDRLNVTNSKELYEWVLREMNKQFQVKDSSAMSIYLGIWID